MRVFGVLLGLAVAAGVIVAVFVFPFVIFGDGLLATEDKLLVEQQRTRRAVEELDDPAERAIQLADARERRTQRRVRQAAIVFVALPMFFGVLVLVGTLLQLAR